MEVIYQQMVQLVARAFYKLEMKILFKDEHEADGGPSPPQKGRAAKKVPVGSFS